MNRRFEARRDRAVCSRRKIASMKGLTANQTSSSTSPGISIDMAKAKRVTFKRSGREHGETSSHEHDAPKTSEYAYFKKLKNNADLHSHSLGKDKKSKDSEDMNNYQDLRFSNHAENVRHINYYSSPSAPALTTAMTPEPTYARGNHHHTFHTPLVGEKQLLNCDLNHLPLHQKSKYSEADVFSKKRKKLCHLIAETSSREVKQLSLKGQDLVTALLCRLFPEGNENIVPCRTEKPKVIESDIFPESLTYNTSKEIGRDFQSDPMMGKDDSWLSLDNHPLECDSIRSREKYLPKWGTTSSDMQPTALSGDFASEFNPPCDASIPGVSSFDKSYYNNFDVKNYNLEKECQQYKRSRNETEWDAAADYPSPLTRLWESFCNENKIARYDNFGHRMTSSFEKYSIEYDPLQLFLTRPYTRNYEWLGEFGSTTYFTKPTEVSDRRVLTVGRESSILPLLSWNDENLTNGHDRFLGRESSSLPQLGWNDESSTNGHDRFLGRESSSLPQLGWNDESSINGHDRFLGRKSSSLPQLGWNDERSFNGHDKLLGRESSSLPQLGWTDENSTNGHDSEPMSFFPPTNWSVNDELHHQTFVYHYPLRYNTPWPPYYHLKENLQPQYPGRRDDLIWAEEDEISDFDNLIADAQNSSPGDSRFL